MNIYDVINILIFIVGITVTGYSLYLIFRCYTKWYLFLPLLVWAAHLSIFYALILLTRINGTSIDIMFDSPGLQNVWSTLQRLNGVITMLFMTHLLAIEIKYDYFKYEHRDK